MITVINVFTVDPANQQRLIGILTEATETSVRRVPGFVSAILHRGSDGTKVAMYAQWETLADYQSMRDDPSARKYFAEARSIATFEPGLYEVVRSFSRAET